MQQKKFPIGKVVRQSDAADELGFAARVRLLRRNERLTLQKLASQSGLAISTRSKIENGQMSPTYETLLRLADGLGIDVAQLFSEVPRAPAARRRSVTRKGQGARLRTPQYEYEMLAADLSRKHFSPLVTDLSAHDVIEFSTLQQHEGEEFIYVLSGSVMLYSDGYEPLRLAVGDSCYFDSTIGHACLSEGAETAKILWVCSRAERLTASPGDGPATQPPAGKTAAAPRMRQTLPKVRPG